MSSPEESIAELQAYVDRFAADAHLLQVVLAQPGVPEAARLSLVGALNYVLDVVDIFPDNYPGLGMADDAMVIRLAADQAVRQGAHHEGLSRLAGEAAAVRKLLGDLGDPLDRFVSMLPDRSVRGRNAARILADPDRHAIFEAEVSRELGAFVPTQIETSRGAANLLRELDRMMREALIKAGVLKVSSSNDDSTIPPQ
jgi:uncharacterized membrane protein YkvA (DUF1232 family)